MTLVITISSYKVAAGFAFGTKSKLTTTHKVIKIGADAVSDTRAYIANSHIGIAERW